MPLTGSLAPFTHASWWFPRTIHSSGNVEPGIFAMTSHSGFVIPVERDLEMDLRSSLCAALSAPRDRRCDRESAARLASRRAPSDRRAPPAAAARRRTKSAAPGIFVRIGESRIGRRGAPGTAADIPASADRRIAVARSSTEPRCTPSLGRIGPFGKHRAAEIPIVSRIGVDEAADGAVLGGDLRLHAAEDLPVADDDDGAARGDAQAFELVVVFDAAVVDVDERRCDVAVDRVGVVGGQLLASSVRSSGRPRRPARRASRRTASARSSRARALSASGTARRSVRSARPSPSALNCASIHSALSLLYGEPT